MGRSILLILIALGGVGLSTSAWGIGGSCGRNGIGLRAEICVDEPYLGTGDPLPPQDPIQAPAPIDDRCPTGQVWRGSGCECANGGALPDCRSPDKPSDPAPTPTPTGPPPCRAQVQSLAAQCQQVHSSASATCSEQRVTAISGNAYAQRESILANSRNDNMSAQTISNALAQASQQVRALVSSCQAAVGSCASACSRVADAAGSCNDSVARQAASGVAGQGQDCQGGPLSQRPAEINRAANRLQSESSAVSTRASESSALTNGNKPYAGGPLAQDYESPYQGYRDSASGYDGSSGVPPSRNHPSENLGKTDEGKNPGGAREENNGLSFPPGSKPSQAANPMYGSPMALAALPTRQPTAAEGEKSDEQVDNALNGSGASTVAGGRGGRRLMPYRLQRRTTGLAGSMGAAGMTGDPSKPNGRGGNEQPDLSQFLPTARRMAGAMGTAMKNACRIPDPMKPALCAVPHGPAMNIWGKMKERFEIMRQNTPAEYFFNEE